MRPYPGLVDGIDNLLSDSDDQLVSVSCGARYTLAMTSSKRAFVWGQVAPSKDYSKGGNHFCGSNSSSSGSRRPGDGKESSLAYFSSPRELKPNELLRAAVAADPLAMSTGGGGAGGCRCGGVGEGAASKNATAEVRGEAGVGKHDDGSDSSWRVSAVGCGPWYIVFELKDSGQQGKTDQPEMVG